MDTDPLVQDDLDPEVVPPEIDHVVERLPDGRLRFPRVVQTPWRAGVGALVGLVPAAMGVVLLLIAGLARSEQMAAVALGPLAGAPLLSLLGFVVLRTAVRPVVAGPDGIQDGPMWGPALAVRLSGKARFGSAKLVLVRPSGEEVPILSWFGLRHHRERGWDHDSVRWFAERIATLAGVVLEDGLPDVEEYAYHEARRDRLRKEPYFECYEADPIPPEEVWDHDGVKVAVPGSSRRLVLIQGSTSHSASVPIALSRTHLSVGNATRSVSDIEEIRVWFGTVKHGKNTYLKAGQIRAVLRWGGSWVLATRVLTTTSAGVMVGAAQALDRVLQQARADGSIDRGAVSDVPEAMRAIAATARAPEDR